MYKSIFIVALTVYPSAYRMGFMNTTPAQMLNEIKSITGLGEIALAEKLGVSQPTVNRILNGQPDCKGKTLQSIASMYQQAMARLRRWYVRSCST